MPDAPATRRKSVQTFGRKKTAVAVAHVKEGRGLVKVNGVPLELMNPPMLKWKVLEPFLLLKDQENKGVFETIDIRVRVKGGGFSAQVYAIRQSIAKGVVAYFQKFVDEQKKMEIKKVFMAYDRALLVADPRRTEAKKFGGPGARARYQKSYR